MFMTNRLENKIAVITGATSGIGEACAVALSSIGVRLILVARDAAKLEAMRDRLGGDIETITLDVRDKEAVRSRLSSLKSVDILINNAGLALGLSTLDEGDIEQWEQMIDTNVKGVLNVSRAIIPLMRERNSGHIINVGSIAGKMEYPGGNVYSATKAAVHSISKSMNIDLIGTGIRVSNVAPGAVETNFSNIRFSGDDAKADAVYEGYRPLSAEDVAELIVYILNAPAHVNIQDTLIMPTAQRNPYMLSREQED